jgi:hypothetical protein
MLLGTFSCDILRFLLGKQRSRDHVGPVCRWMMWKRNMARNSIPSRHIKKASYPFNPSIATMDSSSYFHHQDEEEHEYEFYDRYLAPSDTTEEPLDYTVLSVGVLTLGLILFVEVIRHRLDHEAHGRPFFKTVLEGVYSECKSFIHLINQPDIPLRAPPVCWGRCLNFC